MKHPKSYLTRLQAVTSSPVFFTCIVVLLIAQAAWIALSGRYPMAFDEDFHLGIIKLYAHHLNPFWSAHPPHADSYGAITRDPSYLYHYLMSFPYRVISLGIHSQNGQIIALRFINIGLFATGLPIYRRLLRKTCASFSLIHLVLLLFVLVPISPLLAAQVNYDNLIFPLTALSLLLALRVERSLRAVTIDIKALAGLIIVCTLSSLVKYAYLPVFIATGIFIAVRLWQTHRTFASFKTSFLDGWRSAHGVGLGVLMALLLVSGILFGERYGVNLVRYHTPIPDCAQVLLYDQCQHYGPWIRDYNFAHSKPADEHTNPFKYSQHWLYGMWFRSFFAVDGPQTLYQTRGPLVLPAVSAIILAAVGGLAFIARGRSVWRVYYAPALWLISTASLTYVVVLWLTNYKLFLLTDQPVAINGRYLLPVLPLLIFITGLAISQLLRERPTLRYVVASFAIMSFAWGGGALTYILRSNDTWYWSSTPLRTANHTIQNVLGPVIPGYYQPIEYLH